MPGADKCFVGSVLATTCLSFSYSPDMNTKTNLAHICKRRGSCRHASCDTCHPLCSKTRQSASATLHSMVQCSRTLNQQFTLKTVLQQDTFKRQKQNPHTTHTHTTHATFTQHPHKQNTQHNTTRTRTRTQHTHTQGGGDGHLSLHLLCHISLYISASYWPMSLNGQAAGLLESAGAKPSCILLPPKKRRQQRRHEEVGASAAACHYDAFRFEQFTPT